MLVDRCWAPWYFNPTADLISSWDLHIPLADLLVLESIWSLKTELKCHLQTTLLVQWRGNAYTVPLFSHFTSLPRCWLPTISTTPTLLILLQPQAGDRSSLSLVPTQSRSFQRRSSQPITWLILTDKTVHENTQTKYNCEKQTTQNTTNHNYPGSVAFYEWVDGWLWSYETRSGNKWAYSTMLPSPHVARNVAYTLTAAYSVQLLA